PDDYNSLRQKGVSLSNLGRGEEAIEWYERALEINPDDYDSLRGKGVSLSKLGREKEAIEWYELALEINPDDYDSLRQKGVSLSELGRGEEAIEWYDRALEIKPDDWLSLFSKAFTLEIIGKEEEAIKIFDIISLNEDKINNKEIIEIVTFKKNALKDKELDKKTDVLNEVINAFQEKKDDFFKNINDIESRFKKFVDSERSVPADFFSFLSVLRKWNSYTPILPSEKGDNKGGGYFLYHRGKGIVIDPGFNFIENFYQEGFKVADIDAVLISHAHNDHTVDLESILTLVYKHNDAIKDSVIEEMKDKTDDEIKQEITKRLKEKGKKIDLFMNVGTFMKYSGWLNLKDSHEISSVTVLMPNTAYKLAEEYHGITIHTTKAKHHEVIDDQYAIGFILDIDGIKVGFTADTGWDWDRNEIMVKPFIEHKPNLVVTHLGSIKSREFDYVKATCNDEKNKCFYPHHLGLLGITKFLDVTKPELTIVSEFGEELRGMRKAIVERIGKVLELKCLPGDIGLHVRLSDLGVYCFVEEDFVDYKLINVYSDDSERGSTLCFYRNEPDHEIFNKALLKKQRNISIPLCKRVKSHESDHE
ncbi:tetratricopeptide repeat protein, partial [Methanosarcina sp.]|uniref:tetratricopeptide repeat protein n=1 Tax=Methanosarcina sp. TaxID=2213 RepID=UPI003BB633A7